MSASSPSAPHAADDHFLGACLSLNLGLDLIAVGGSYLATPFMGAVVLIDPAGGGVGHGGSGDKGIGLARPGV